MNALLPWLVPVAAALAAVSVAVLRRRAAVNAVPLADARALAKAARRPTAARATLAALCVVALGAVAALVQEPADGYGELLSGETSTVIVLDVSASVSDLVYREIARTLSGIADSASGDERVGLVVFSDVAQEALPPGTSAEALRPFVRYFLPKQEPGASRKPSYYRAAGPAALPPVPYPQNPWFRKFSGGTRIASGLEVAREALARDGYRAGRVLLLSDLAESEDDLGRLAAELSTYAQTPSLELDVVGLPPATPADAAVFDRLLARPGATVLATNLRSATGDAGQGGGTAFPFWIAILAAAIALGLGASELLQPLTWRGDPREVG